MKIIAKVHLIFNYKSFIAATLLISSHKKAKILFAALAKVVMVVALEKLSSFWVFELVMFIQMYTTTVWSAEILTWDCGCTTTCIQN
jgi:hypothetical protein